jgi:hypothetical protein
MFPRRRDYSAARHRAPLPVRLNRAGRERNRDIDLFFDYKRQKGKVGLFDLVDVKEPSRSSSTMTRAFCQLSAAARFALPAAGAAGSHKLTSRVFRFAASDVARPDPRRRLILAHLEDAPGRLDHEPGAVQTFSAAWRVAGAVVN